MISTRQPCERCVGILCILGLAEDLTVEEHDRVTTQHQLSRLDTVGGFLDCETLDVACGLLSIPMRFIDVDRSHVEGQTQFPEELGAAGGAGSEN